MGNEPELPCSTTYKNAEKLLKFPVYLQVSAINYQLTQNKRFKRMGGEFYVNRILF